MHVDLNSGLVSFFGMLMVAAISWGVLQQKISNLQSQFEDYKKRNDLAIYDIKNLCNTFVKTESCKDYRKELSDVKDMLASMEVRREAAREGYQKQNADLIDEIRQMKTSVIDEIRQLKPMISQLTK